LAWWGNGESFEEALWGSVTVTLAVHTLPAWTLTLWALLVAMVETSTLPATTVARFVVELGHF